MIFSIFPGFLKVFGTDLSSGISFSELCERFLMSRHAFESWIHVLLKYVRKPLRSDCRETAQTMNSDKENMNGISALVAVRYWFFDKNPRQHWPPKKQIRKVREFSFQMHVWTLKTVHGARRTRLLKWWQISAKNLQKSEKKRRKIINFSTIKKKRSYM